MWPVQSGPVRGNPAKNSHLSLAQMRDSRSSSRPQGLNLQGTMFAILFLLQRGVLLLSWSFPLVEALWCLARPYYTANNRWKVQLYPEELCDNSK